MKRILLVTFLNFFVSGGLTLAIPLLLLEQNVDLINISIVISVLPLFFLVIRLVLALAADLKGWSRFYLLLNWPASIISTLIYFVATSVPVFLLGKVVEAIRESSYWAVNRTAIFSLSPGREEKEATRNTAVLLLSTAIGSAVAGLGLSYLGSSSTLTIFVGVSALIGVPAAMLWKIPKQNQVTSSGVKTPINLRGRGRMFWFVSLTMLFYSLARYPLITLLLPVFMSQQLGLSYTTIGIAFMLYNVIASVVVVITLRFSLSAKRAILQSVVALFASVFMAFSNGYFLLLFFALAFTEGLGTGFYESIIAKATKKGSSVSFDIGLLHLPRRFAEFASVLYAGAIAQFAGYLPVFVFCGVFFAVFSCLSLHFLKSA